MKLTERQQEKAIGVRELLSPKGESCKECGQSVSLASSWSERMDSPDGDAWFAFVDCTRALGKMINGLDDIQSLSEMRSTFDDTWKAYIKFWGREHERLLRQALGYDAMLLDRVKEHQNGKRIVDRILERIKKSNGGTISTGIDAAAVDVVDILEDEMGSEWME